MAERIAKKTVELNGVKFDLSQDAQRAMYFALLEKETKATIEFKDGHLMIDIPIVKAEVLQGMTETKETVGTSRWHGSGSGKRATRSYRIVGKGYNGNLTVSFAPESFK